MNIQPTKDFPSLLMSVENPGRYVGGEFGAIEAQREAIIRVALCFPDLYEIGMSNNAIRILYRLLNDIPGVVCERVFAPAPDFERLLIDKDIPLYGLENGTPLGDFDVVAFSIGYELSATNILTILDRGGIPLKNAQRSHLDPIVIAGGPAVTNPLPYGEFIDAFYIGEAEESIETLFTELVTIKTSGGNRQELLERILFVREVWYAGKTETTTRAIWDEFGTRSLLLEPPIVPNIRVVQDHGVVEVMRGCPNGCRFCHAGVFYRPYRMKHHDLVRQEVECLVHRAGYRHITLSSLSSADYYGVRDLIHDLTSRYQPQQVSFALPSLRVNAVNLDLLEQIASVRRSGLTFAVETPTDLGQFSLNKVVDRDGLVDLLREAQGRGWRVAKFYFMIGLPHTDWATQIDQIFEYLKTLRSKTKLQLNVNVATFVPKPHTPFQWAAQMSETAALADLSELKRDLKRIGIKLSYPSPFHSSLEGIIARGDERVGALIEAAYRGGTRLDAWDEHCRRDVWNSAIDAAPWPVRQSIERERGVDEDLPWDPIRLGPTKAYLRSEYEQAASGKLSAHCAPECEHHCSICNSQHVVRDLCDSRGSNSSEHGPGEATNSVHTDAPTVDCRTSGPAYRLTFAFRRSGSAAFVPHLATMGVFERSLQRAGIPVTYSQGFNPKPKLEFAQPLSLGIASDEEIAAVDVYEVIQPEDFSTRLSCALPPGFAVSRAVATEWELGKKTPDSLMSLYWGSRYRIALQPGYIEPSMDVLAHTLRQTQGVSELDYAREEGDARPVVYFDLESDDGRFPGVKTLLSRILGDHPVAVGLTVTRIATYRKCEEAGRTRYL